MEKKKWNLLYMTPATAPIFLVGFIANSMIITVIGLLLLVCFVFGGLKQLD